MIEISWLWFPTNNKSQIFTVPKQHNSILERQMTSWTANQISKPTQAEWLNVESVWSSYALCIHNLFRLINGIICCKFTSAGMDMQGWVWWCGRTCHLCAEWCPTPGVATGISSAWPQKETFRNRAGNNSAKVWHTHGEDPNWTIATQQKNLGVRWTKNWRQDDDRDPRGPSLRWWICTAWTDATPSCMFDLRAREEYNACTTLLITAKMLLTLVFHIGDQ